MKCRLPSVAAVAATAAVILCCAYYYNYGNGRALQVNEYNQVRLEPPSSGGAMMRKEDDPMRNFKPLTSKTVNGVKTFLLFIGYQHSGHSILTAMLDAHPNIILSAKYELLSRWNKKIKERVQGDKPKLFNEIYKHSAEAASTVFKKVLAERTQYSKGYSLFVPTMMQGRFTQLEILGDKSVGMFAAYYDENWPAMAEETYDTISKIVDIPIKTIHLVRNPFDMIATHSILRVNRTFLVDNRWESGKKLSVDLNIVMATFDYYRNLSLGASTLQYKWPDKYDVLEVHYADFIHHPKQSLQQMCEFIGVECNEDYLEACQTVMFKSVSKTRYLLEWDPEAMKAVQDLIKQHPFFERYSFDSD